HSGVGRGLTEGMAAAAMEQADSNGDGFLSEEELTASAPGLGYNLEAIDTDGDGQLSMEEIAARIKEYRDMGVGLASTTCLVTLKGRPLPNATVKFIPEPFLGDIVEPATGTTTIDGLVRMKADGSDVKAVRVGMYRVEITDPRGKVPAKYNTETEQGIEVSGMTDPNRNIGNPHFDLR
ncbi:MAG: EF-hand domain-containing protein, partial [Planctomycetota bacterium]